MPELFSRPLFNGFGPNELGPVAPEMALIESPRAVRLKLMVRAQCQRRPGIYGMVDQRGELIYVGKAKSLRARLLSYFRTKSRPPKAREILRHTVAIAWEHNPSEFAALLRELDMIQKWRPRYNVAGQPRRQRKVFICLGRRPAPYLFLSPKITAKVESWFGPVSVGAMAAEALRRLNDWYRLRDCPQPQEMVFRDQQELFPLERAPACIRHDIGHCVAPCAAKCSQQEYEVCAGAAMAFLEGKDSSPLDMLRREIQKASEAMQFERAALLLGRLEPLEWLQKQLERLRSIRALSFVYPVEGYEGEDQWYAVHQGQVRAVLPIPKTKAEKAKARERLEQIYQDRPGRLGEELPENMGRALLVAAWFRRSPEEEQRKLSPKQAIAALKT